MKAELRQSYRTELFKDAPIGLLQGIHLLQYGTAVLSCGLRVRIPGFRDPRQRAGMRSQRKQMRSKLIMQFARNFLAFNVLQRHDARGQTPLFVNGIAQRGSKMVQLVANGSEFRRTIRLHARVVATGLDLRHRLRKCPDRCERQADDPGCNEEKNQRSHCADLQLGNNSVPDLGHLVVRMRRNQQRTWFSLDRNRHADGGLFGVNKAEKPRWRRTCVSIVVGSVHLPGSLDSFTLPRDADVTQPVEVVNNLVQPRFGVRSLVQSRTRSYQ